MNGEGLVAVGLVLGGALYLAMAWYVWLRRRAAAAGALLGVLFAIFVWTLGYAVELTTRTVAAAQLWSCVKYLGVVSLAPAFLAFCVEFTGRGRRMSPAAIALLSIEPVIVLSLLWFPPTHDLVLYYRQADVQGGVLDHYPMPQSGPLFAPHAVYNYVVLASALGLLVSRMIRLPQPYRRPAVVVAVVSTLTFLANVLYNFATRIVPVDFTPFIFSLLAVVLVWGFFRLRLVDIVPVARGQVMEQMADGVLVLDAYNRVIDANPVAADLLRVTRRQMQGCDVRTLLPAASDLVDGARAGESRQAEIALPAVDAGAEGALGAFSDLVPDRLAGADGQARERHLALTLSPLTDRRAQEVGRLLVLRDVTQRTATERKLRELLEAEQHLAAVLATSLRPASLPNVPRLHLAARSLPAGEGSRVSGDFYDVHQALGGDWAFVLGDVAGKGVHAAVVTSMARYTVRTLSAQGWSPKQVVEQLNQALIVETEPERFLTMVYGRIGERDVPDGDDALCRAEPGVRLTVALGGHPPPLVRRLDGRVEAVGVPGTALGIVSLVDVQEVTIDLLPGEVLLAYTDGVTEARRDGVEFGEERLAETLAGAAAGLLGCTGAAAAKLVCDAVADRVVDTVTSFASHRDDVAVLVLAVS